MKIIQNAFKKIICLMLISSFFVSCSKDDEGYFTIDSTEIEQGKGIRWLGAVGKSNVAIMAESKVLEDIETGKN